MGLFSFAFAGVGFILIGTHESLTATLSNQNQNHSPPNSTPQTITQDPKPTNKFSSYLFPISLSIFASFFILDSIASLIDAHKSNDAVGSALQLQAIAIALIFLLYSVLALFNNLPSTFLGLIGAFAFLEEFLFFYLQRKDPNGVENRYYNLLLVPIAVCVFSTLLELLESPRTMSGPGPNFGKLGRGIGLILQGTWFIQMGMSIFSNWVAQGCSLHKVSRGNYTLRCKGHMEYHRGSALATLQFNCHLALMVVVVVAMFSLVSGRNGGGGGRGRGRGRGRGGLVDDDPDAARYRPLGAEVQMLENSANFTLDSDDDDDHADEIKGGNVAGDQKAVVVEHGMNGHGSQH